jgi:hypothetical protein
LICDGSVVVDSSSTYNGITLPDTRGKFRRNHSTLSNASFPADNAYKAGGTIPSGGIDSNNFAHTHGFSVSGGGHGHTVNSHSHSVSSDGDHSHGNTPGATFNDAAPAGAVLNAGSHNHTGSTGTIAPGTDFYAGFTIGGTTVSGLGSIDNKPVYQEYVTIIKIK